MTEFGPYSVKPEQISSLGTSFATFINKLLDIETAAAGLSGATLVTTHRENVGDGGVDAALRSSKATRWIPAGESAWQFKAGDLPPSKCKAEIEGAIGARGILANGGNYRLVLGVALNAKTMKNRRDALISRAQELSIEDAEARIEILDSNSIARWVEDHPSLAVAAVLRGVGHVGQDFETWAKSNRHETRWVPSQSRTELASEIARMMTDSSRFDLRIEGVSGLGKTRSTLEAFRGSPNESLVIYFRSEDTLPADQISRLLIQERAAIVIVDECSRRRHESLAGLLPSSSTVRLITIGEPDTFLARTSLVALAPLDDTTMDRVLIENFPSLWNEARRVVVQAAAGNVKYGLYLGKLVLERPRTTASELITVETITTYATRRLQDGTLFLACSALALLTRVGFDGVLGSELDQLATHLGLSTIDLRNAARELDELGLLTATGRYRSVSPYPVAVYLANAAWDVFAPRIVSDLLPNLGLEMAERLLIRAAQVGGSDRAKWAVEQILSDEGPFRSFSAMAEDGSVDLLPQIAILAPEAALRHITRLIDSTDRRDLQADLRNRRGLVNSLTKLVWHSETFARAAGCLLSLALAENESWGNNATGTWVALFGLMLPATSASPSQRSNYLREVASKSDKESRLLSIKACEKALEPHESTMVDGELQGGVVVAQRGRPDTWSEVFEYQNAILTTLSALAVDGDNEVRFAAEDVLVGKIHALLESAEDVRDHFFRILSGSSTPLAIKARQEVLNLKALFDRVNSDTEQRATALAELADRLPEMSKTDELRVLANSSPWDYDGDVLAGLIGASLEGYEVQQASELVTVLLAENPRAVFDVGKAVASMFSESVGVPLFFGPERELRSREGLAGFLWWHHDHGDVGIFDRVLDAVDNTFSLLDRMYLTARGPRTGVASNRLDAIVGTVEITKVVQYLAAWGIRAPDDQLERWIRIWLGQISTQLEYNAVVDFANTAIYRRDDRSAELDEALVCLAEKRADFPDTSHQSWDWSELAKRIVKAYPLRILNVVVEILLSRVYNGFGLHDEDMLVREALSSTGMEGWAVFARGLREDSWRMRYGLQGWPAETFVSEIVCDWIGTDIDRARSVAINISPDSSIPNGIVRYLLTHFSDDSNVSSSLAANFVSGGWTGNESDRLVGMISRLAGWSESTDEPSGVRKWAREMVAGLQRQRQAALLREAEGF